MIEFDPRVLLRRPATALAAVAAIEAFTLAIAFSTGGAARSGAAELMRGGMPDEAIVIAASGVSIGPLSLHGGSLPTSLAGELRTDPTIQRVLIEESLALPASVSGSFFGHAYGSDVAVIGVEPEQAAWIAPGVDAADFIDRRPLPLLAPRLVLDAYNATFAEANGLPRLTESAFLGRTFLLEVGVSSLRSMPEAAHSMEARLVGFASRRDLTLGVIAPLAVVQRLNASAGVTDPSRRLLLFARGPAEGEELVARLRGRGYSVEAPMDRLKNLRRLDTALATAALLTSSALGFLAAVGSFFAAAARVQTGRAESELMHQIGCSRFEIVGRFVKSIVTSALLGATSGAAGALILLFATGGALYAALPLPLTSPSPASIIIFAVSGALLPTVAISAGAILGGFAIIPPWRVRGA